MASFASTSKSQLLHNIDYWRLGQTNSRLKDLAILRAGLNKSLLAKWDFSREFVSDRIVNVFDGSGHGQLINALTMAVTASNGDSTKSDWTKARYGCDSTHFHECDLHDANWDTDITMTLPECLRSAYMPTQFHSLYNQRPQQAAQLEQEQRTSYPQLL